MDIIEVGDLLSVWAEGFDLSDLMFPESRKDTTTMYRKHTVTFATTASRPEIEDAIRWDLGAIDYSHLSEEPHIDPKARITNDRLKAYHARMRGAGFATPQARHAFRDAVLGHKVAVASALTNAEFDKIMAALDG